MIDTSDCIVVVANFDEIYTPTISSASRILRRRRREVARGLWQKALLCQDQEGCVLISPAVPSNLDPVGGAWCAPGHLVVPKPRSGSVCRDLVDDQRAWAKLIRFLSKRQTRVRIVPQLHSPGIEVLVDALLTSGIDVDTAELPLVSGYTVAYWNTKVGGRELLQSDPQVRRSLPSAAVCNTLAEVTALVATADINQGIVVKANSSMGGVGTWTFPANADRRAEVISTTISEQKSRGVSRWKPTYRKKTGWETAGPYIVEEMVGDIERNCSPTADFWISVDSPGELIGMGEQLLEDGVAYHGCRYPIRAEPARLERCVELGLLICMQLHRRGYRGFLNVDYILPPDGGVWVAEINLRESAPLDQFLVMRRLFGDSWADKMSFVCEEAVALHGHSATVQDVSESLLSELELHKDQIALPLAVYDGPVQEVASVLVVAGDRMSVETLAAVTRCESPEDINGDA